MDYCLSTNSYYEDENYYWFSEIQYNGFYRVDKQTGVSELLFRFSGEDLEGLALFRQILKAGDWFVFSPMSAKKIVLYHSISKEIKYISLKPVEGKRKIQYKSNGNFSSMALWDGKVFFFPWTYPAVVVLDLQTMSLRYLSGIVNRLEHDMPEHPSRNVMLYFNCSLQNAQKVYLPSACSNHLAVLDLETLKEEIHPIHEKETGFHGIAFDGTHLWLAPVFGTDLVKWTHDTCEIVALEKDVQTGKNLVNQLQVYHNRLFVSSGFGLKIYEVDVQTHQVTVAQELMKHLPQTAGFQNAFSTLMLYFHIVDNRLDFICGNDRHWYTYDLETEILSEKSFPMDEIGVEILKKRPVFRPETKQNTLMDFFELVVEMEKIEEKKEQEKPVETIGEIVFQATTSFL